MDCISVAERLGISSTAFTQCAPNFNDFAEITKIAATMPFKVTDFCTNQKVICEFLLVINTVTDMVSCTVSEI